MINNLKRNKDEWTRSNRGMSRSTLKGRLNDRVICALVVVSLTQRRSMRTRQQVATTASHPPLRRTLVGCVELEYKWKARYILKLHVVFSYGGRA